MPSLRRNTHIRRENKLIAELITYLNKFSSLKYTYKDKDCLNWALAVNNLNHTLFQTTL